MEPFLKLFYLSTFYVLTFRNILHKLNRIKNQAHNHKLFDSPCNIPQLGITLGGILLHVREGYIVYISYKFERMQFPIELSNYWLHT